MSLAASGRRRSPKIAENADSVGRLGDGEPDEVWSTKILRSALKNVQLLSRWSVDSLNLES